jgi:hypothetical protein
MKYFKSLSSDESDRPTASFTVDTSSTSTSTPTTHASTSTSTGSTDSQRKIAKRLEMERKWAEEERRDRLRREKREREKVARATEEQDRDVEEIPQREEVLEDYGVLSHGEVKVATSGSAMDSTPTDVGEVDVEKSPVMPLEAEAEGVDHGFTPVNVVDEGTSVPAGDGVSAATPLEEEAAAFEGESEAVKLAEEEAINRIVDEL